MNKNSMAIIILCSYLCEVEGIKPFEPSEWGKIAQKLIECRMEPYEVIELSNEKLEKILNFSSQEIERINKLISRSANIAFELKKLQEIGINIVTRADKEYPKLLKKKLKSNCPPLLYYIGELNIANMKSIGFVGSRSANEEDKLFVNNIISKIDKNKYAICSGGAKGVDTFATEYAYQNQYYVIQYIADSFLKKIKDIEVIEAIKNKKMLIISSAKPNASFNVGMLMARNKYIYSQSEATIVVKSDYKKGGTWSGAIECLRKKYCNLYCQDIENKGNKELIELGLKPIDNNWDGNIEEFYYKESENKKVENYGEQITLF